MRSYKKTQVSPYGPTKLAIDSVLRPEDDLKSNCGRNFEKTVSFDDIVHFIDEENIAKYMDFDCGITFNLKFSQNSNRSSQDGIIFPDSVENPSAFPATINITVLLMSSIALMSF